MRRGRKVKSTGEETMANENGINSGNYKFKSKRKVRLFVVKNSKMQAKN